jgi:2-polyprenyl-3-methyl-5-hydroxy-6-metoxy-1,4-benzoquinol methylase
MDNPQWELNYQQGKEINKYPFDILISFWFKYKHLINNTNSSIKICEIGCGCGNNLSFFAQIDKCDVYGIDISPTAINYSKQLFKQKKLKGNFFIGNFLKHTEFNEKFKGYFDLIIERGCLTHNPIGYDKCIEKISELLKPNGVCFTTLFTQNDTRLLEYSKKTDNIYYFLDKKHRWFNLPVLIYNFKSESKKKINDLYDKYFKKINQIVNTMYYSNEQIKTEFIHFILQKK